MGFEFNIYLFLFKTINALKIPTRGFNRKFLFTYNVNNFTSATFEIIKSIVFLYHTITNYIIHLDLIINIIMCSEAGYFIKITYI